MSSRREATPRSQSPQGAPSTQHPAPSTWNPGLLLKYNVFMNSRLWAQETFLFLLRSLPQSWEDSAPSPTSDPPQLIGVERFQYAHRWSSTHGQLLKTFPSTELGRVWLSAPPRYHLYPSTPLLGWLFHLEGREGLYNYQQHSTHP